MIDFQPKFVTFDCYGTLTWFQIVDVTSEYWRTGCRRTRWRPSWTPSRPTDIDEVMGD